MSKFKRTISIILLVITLSSCASKKIIYDRDLVPSLGLKIGLIADSQLTSQKYIKGGFHFRSKIADRLANVAIRTPAQELLASKHLELMINDLIAQSPDVILYLGDGLNSGCKDEHKVFWKALEDAQKRSNGIPIFFVIGNHDYLSTGNDARPKARIKMCPDGYITKRDLIQKANEFNKKPSLADTGSEGDIFSNYQSNIDSLTSKELDELCGKKEHKQHYSECFYVAGLDYSLKGINGKLMLMDTSDYKDINIVPELFTLGFAGVRGALSWKGASQSAWAKNYLKGHLGPRVFAAHYPRADLNWIGRWSGKPSMIFSKEASVNLWLSAHTHTKQLDPDVRQLATFKTGEKDDHIIHNEFNVGSTTDFRPHVAIINGAKEYTTAKAIYSIDSAGHCGYMEKKYAEVRRGQKEVLGGLSGHEALGITDKYRDKMWSENDNSNSKSNLSSFLASFTDGHPREHATRCVMYKASMIEHRLDSLL